MRDEEKQESEFRIQKPEEKEREERICQCGFSLIFWLLTPDS
jgi:hypothetical protein